jgi:hypothetical protein
MKKIALALCLIAALLPLGARASANSHSGSVVAARQVSIRALYGGVVEDFALRPGDALAKGDAPFAIGARAVYAPADGVIAGLRAQPGDDAAFVQDQYGALMYIERPGRYFISTSTSEAYDDSDNKFIHVGEAVYLVSTGNSDRTGEGFVTQVDGKDFTVEVTSGNLRINEKATIYRDAGHKNASRIGRGTTKRLADVPVTAEGSVLRLHVGQGDAVRRGDLIAQMADGALSGLSAPAAAALCPEDGIVASVLVEAGEKVEKDQVLALVYPDSALEVEALVSESELEGLAPGGSARVELENGGALIGTITSLSGLGEEGGGDVRYALRIALNPGDKAPLGMSATIYPIG